MGREFYGMYESILAFALVKKACAWLVYCGRLLDLEDSDLINELTYLQIHHVMVLRTVSSSGSEG